MTSRLECLWQTHPAAARHSLVPPAAQPHAHALALTHPAPPALASPVPLPLPATLALRRAPQCDRWEGSVEAGKVYLISKASLRNKRGNFNQTRHAYEIHLETHSQVEPCPDDDQDGSDIPLIFFNVRFREGGGRAL